MCDEVHHIEPRYALLMQVINGVRVFFTKDGDQHIGAGDFLLAAAGRLHVHDGALNHALKAQRRLRIDIIQTRHLGRVVLDEVRQRLAQIVNIGRTGPQHLSRAWVVQQREQQVFHRDELMALLARLNERHMQAYFQFLGNHVISL